MSSWRALDEEMRHWAALGETPTFWWRDDDAVSMTPLLRRLVDVTAEASVPCAIAAVPAGADESLGRLFDTPTISVLQHGVAHTNRASPDAKKSEFPSGLVSSPHADAHRRLARGRTSADVAAGETADEIRRARAKLSAIIGGPVTPLFVPPWNRFAAELVDAIVPNVCAAISCFGLPKGRAFVNTHVDVIDWRGSRGFVGEAAAVSALVAHLRARRDGAAARTEATGLLTHHLVHDEGVWTFLDDLIAFAAKHRWHWVSSDALICSERE